MGLVDSTAVITRREAFVLLQLVLENAFLKVSCNSYVERVAATGYEVSEVRALVYVLILS